MTPSLDKIRVYRMIAIQNLDHELQNGLYCKNSFILNAKYSGIGSSEVIDRRSSIKVKCFPDTVVNDYVPFYFSVRTPMLFNIISGWGVPKIPQENIIYLCFKLQDLATDNYQWCFTDGNAATAFTKFFNDLSDLDKLDWKSIKTQDFREDNGDEDRKRKKHSEFLVKHHLYNSNSSTKRSEEKRGRASTC